MRRGGRGPAAEDLAGVVLDSEAVGVALDCDAFGAELGEALGAEPGGVPDDGADIGWTDDDAAVG